ncbi:MAG: D-alanine--D-alanine ligase A [Chlamydiae bacterium]|nr:D-alanine--D-alanine ligase A [Chlamydiota bacterium]
MKKKINVGILFGGKSVEHEVALQSAKSVVEALDREKYNVILIGIDKEGKWHLHEESDYLLNADDPKAIALGPKKREVQLQKEEAIDVVFPALHGAYGEDGSIQGLCKLANLPFVGANILGSAVGMDKDVMKRLIRDAGIPTPKFISVHQHERHLWTFEKVEKILTFPIFVKPSNSGSSIGISKVKSFSEFEEAIDFAFQFDRKILIEEAVDGVEVQCALLGNEHPIVSLPCQIKPKGEFHSYASKYIDPDGAEFLIPAPLTPEQLSNVQTTARQAYKILCCEGMARVDLFLSNEGEIFFNEINTLPGLTNMSPYTKMWQATGLSFSEMLDRLIQLALDRHRKEEKLVTKIEAKEQQCVKV